MPDGAMNWIEIPATDVEKQAQFYETVFGWSITRSDSFPDYPMFRDKTGNVGGGFSPQWQPSETPGFVPHIQTDDMDGTLKKIEQNGGRVVQGKTPIPGTGHYALFTDPSGNQVGLHDDDIEE